MTVRQQQEYGKMINRRDRGVRELKDNDSQVQNLQLHSANHQLMPCVIRQQSYRTY